ncbi:hypothetical protein AAZV13_14G067700 [Glycine max]
MSGSAKKLTLSTLLFFCTQQDLKPENVLAREDGHVMLSDCDLSIKCGVPKLLRSKTRLERTIKSTKEICTSLQLLKELILLSYI